MNLSQNMIKVSTIFTETFHVRAITFIAKIPLYNNSCYCYFKAIMLSVFYESVGFGGRKEREKKGGRGALEKAQAYSGNLCEAQMPKASFVHY